MKKKGLSLLRVVLPVVISVGIASCGESAPQAISARLNVHTNSIVGPVDDKIFGHFIENLGRCFYGGIWDEETPVERLGAGLRMDVLNFAKALSPPVIRFPGGLYADAYHWQNGIGPRELRPVIENPYWAFMGSRFAPPDTNHFGTDEFFQFLNYVGGEAYIQVNYSTGTTEEAAEWVEYVNGSTDTYWGAKRASYGHREPYNVTIWGVGNEIWGWWALGHTDAVSYAKRYLEFTRAMKAVSPDIRFTAAGYDAAWNRAFLEIAGEDVDYLTIHVYLPGGNTAFIAPKESTYYSVVGSPVYVSQMVKNAYEDIVYVLGEDSGTTIAFDEWNVGWRANDVELGREFTMREALFTAGVLIEMIRLSAQGMLSMANYAQMVNTLGLIYTDGPVAFVTPPYYAFLLASTIRNTVMFEHEITGPAFDADALGDIPPLHNVPMVDAVPVRENNGNIQVMFLNRNIRSEAVLSLAFDDCLPREGEVRIYTSTGPYSRTLEEKRFRAGGECTIILKLPPHSFGLLSLRERY